MIIRTFDIETTGFDPPEHKVCELGWCDVLWTGQTWEVDRPFAVLVNPQRPIPPEASAVHHITDEMVKDAILLPEAIWKATRTPDVIAYAAHFAKFERKFLEDYLDQPWICTWKNAILLAPNAREHNNQYLRYWLKLSVDPTLAEPPHRAGPDAYVTAHLLRRELGKMPVKEMIEIQKHPAILPWMTFGKHARGREEEMPCADIPNSYYRWVLKNVVGDEDAIATAKHYLEWRRKNYGMNPPQSEAYGNV